MTPRPVAGNTATPGARQSSFPRPCEVLARNAAEGMVPPIRRRGNPYFLVLPRVVAAAISTVTVPDALGGPGEGLPGTQHAPGGDQLPTDAQQTIELG